MRISDWSSDVCSSDLVSLGDILGVEEGSEMADQSMIVLKPAGGDVYAPAVDLVHDHEELVVKPAAPAVMATGLYAGNTLADDELGRASCRERVCQYV